VRISNLLSRLVTAGAIVPILAWVLFFGPAWAWWVLVASAVVVSAMELFSMTDTGDPVAQAIHVATTLGVSIVVYVHSTDPVALLTVLLAVPLAGMLVPLWRLGDIKTAGLRQMAGIGGPLYIGVALTTVAMLRHDMGSDGAGYVAMTLTFAWLGDTGAYFSGRYLGRAKLYPEISPGKTRAGFLGAMGGASVGALLAHFWYLPSIPLIDALGLAVVGGGMGQLGDLAESLLKRSSGMKDSGWILPGHGGLLDRIDALMIVSPIVYIYTLWLVHRGG
jgi:phosphatidate cytidylyltransferase